MENRGIMGKKDIYDDVDDLLRDLKSDIEDTLMDEVLDEVKILKLNILNKMSFRYTAHQFINED